MSDQNVITDYRAYFASLGPGTPFSPEQLEAMRDKNSRVRLILNDKVGSLLNQVELSDADCLDEALELWTNAGKPQAWLQLGLGTAPWFCNAVSSLLSKSKVRS